jgi:hypothetical protein
MSTPKTPDPAKLVIGLYTGDRELFPLLARRLSDRFGTPDAISAWMPFDETDYYEREMGSPLFRRMMSFDTLVSQDDLAAIKLTTNALEAEFGQEGRRRVNLDPGYLVLSRFVLATGKDFAHRISIGQGIYGDLTLLFRNGEFETLPWTYPDYAGQAMRTWLHRVRDVYLLNLKTKQWKQSDD